MSNRTRFPATRSRVRNRILSALTDDEYRSISRHLSFVELKQGEVLFNADNWIEYAYFINSGMASSVSVTAEGQTVEDGTVGLEGLLGGSAAFGECQIFCSGIVQIPGNAMRIAPQALRYEAKYNAGFSKLLTDYLCDLRLQLDQSNECHDLHSLEQRLCSLLLMCQDCARSSIFPFTINFLSHIVGATRAAVSIAAASLHEAGLITYRPSWIKIMEREELERRACSCYRLCAHRYDQPALLGNAGIVPLRLVVSGAARNKSHPRSPRPPE
jgi:CRP-like cAMP-binding protein